MNDVKSIVTEAVLQFLNEGPKSSPKMVKPSTKVKLNEKQQKFEEFLKNLKVNLSEK